MKEDDQLAQLNKMRFIATGLLVFMAVVFVGAKFLEPFSPYFSFVAAFAEAAMVGALADWFAVTALFRQPFGLPIPHTAIIPRNKDRVGQSLANFLEKNFITPEIVSEELKEIDFAGAATKWLMRPENSQKISAQIVKGIPSLLRAIEDEEVTRFLQSRMKQGLENVKFAPFLAELLAILITENRHQMVFNHLLGMATHALEEHGPYLRQKVHEKSPRWMPKALDEKFFERFLEMLQSILEEMKKEDSGWRQRFQQAADDLIEQLKTSPDYEEKISSAVKKALQHPLLHKYADQMWHDIKSQLLAEAASDNSAIAARLNQAFYSFSEALAQEPAIGKRLNFWIHAVATEAIVSQRQAITELVARVIRKWDAETVSRKIELHVGKDLQYIRINGTLVGGLVGLMIHLVSFLF